MPETSAGHTIRKNFFEYGQRMKVPVHFQRIETGAIASGVPDANVCFDGKELWLEGKHIKELPVRDTTLVRFSTTKNDARLIHQGNWLKKRQDCGGRCAVWIRLDSIDGNEMGAWFLLEKEFRYLSLGMPKSQFLQLPRFATGKALVRHLIDVTLL